jgi:hypothetical protein
LCSIALGGVGEREAERAPGVRPAAAVIDRNSAPIVATDAGDPIDVHTASLGLTPRHL